MTFLSKQMIISVSQMLGNIVGLNNARFQESLSLINSYATSDKVMKGTGTVKFLFIPSFELHYFFLSVIYYNLLLFLCRFSF